MGKELEQALARRERRLARASIEELLRSIPGLEFEGFDEDPALPFGGRGFNSALIRHVEADAELSSRVPAADQQEWLMGLLDAAGIGQECYLFLDRLVPWARVRVSPSAWKALLALRRGLLALGVGAKPKLLRVFEDDHEDRLFAFILDPGAFPSTDAPLARNDTGKPAPEE